MNNQIIILIGIFIVIYLWASGRKQASAESANSKIFWQPVQPNQTDDNKLFTYSYQVFNQIDPKSNQGNKIAELWDICFRNESNPPIPFHDNTVLCLCQKGDELVGFVGLLTTLDLMQYFNANGIKNPDMYGISNWKGVYLFNFGVHPNYRNRKIGQKLLEMAIKWAETNQKEYIHLLVEANNKIANHIYQKYGFQIVRENYNEQQQSVYVQRKILAPI